MDDCIANYDYAPDTLTMVQGKEVCLVARPVCLDFQTNLHCMVTVPFSKTFRYKGSLEPDMVTYSLMRVKVEQAGPTPLLVNTASTKIWGHPQSTWEDATNLVDLCSGMGGMGQGAKAAMFNPVTACDIRDKMLDLYSLHSSAACVRGDITQISTLHEVYMAHPKGTTLAAGISCQPYSKLGDGRSGADERSLTLPAALAAGHFLRSVAIVLECVEPAGQDAYVRWHVDQFCSRTGFHKAETVLHLHDVWPCKRSRWWCVLTAPAIGPVDLKTFPKVPDLPTVRHVFPSVPSWDVASEKALMLSAVEIEAFAHHGDGCTTHLLNFSGVMPCALHAWGSQVTACPCGCRSTGLSPSRLSSRGLHGVLVRSTIQDGTCIKGAFRHLHPQEAACLCGMDPCLSWGSSPRLALGAVGQFASPLHVFWIFTQLMKQFETVHTGSWSVKPYAALLAYRSWLLARAQHAWEGLSVKLPASEALSMSAHWSQVKSLPIDMVIQDCGGVVQKFEMLKAMPKPLTPEPQPEQSPERVDLTADQVVIPTPTEACESTEDAYPSDSSCVEVSIQVIDEEVEGIPATVLVPVGTTVEALVLAEMELQHCKEHYLIQYHSGQAAQSHDVIEKPVGIDIIIQAQRQFVATESRQVCPPATEVLSPLSQIKGGGFLEIEGPRVTVCIQAQSLRAQTICSKDRIDILANQGTVWGDDEIVWHLARIQQEWIEGQHAGVGKPHIIDPLLMHGWQFETDHKNVEAWFDANDRPEYFITAILCQRHWIPFVGLITEGKLEVVYQWSAPVDHHCVEHLISLIAKVWYPTSQQVTPMEGVNILHYCGAQAISFLEHVVLGNLLSETAELIQVEHCNLRMKFKSALEGAWLTCHPWMWGDGHDGEEQALNLLRPVLKGHGVHPDKLQSRALQAIKMIGSEDIVNACVSKSPWRSLKVLGNNVKFQFILPDELQNKIAQKAGGDEAGRSVKKSKGKKPQKSEEDIYLDPSKLVLPDGVFHCDRQPMAQLTLSQVGPLAEGVAITTASEAEPFVRASKFVSAGPLALLILHAPNHMWSTNLPHLELTVPARCVVNEEPLLLNATLVQLGNGKVEKTAVTATQHIEPAQVVTVKATVYMDEVQQSWDQVVSGPVKYVLQQLSCLRLCSEPHCKCDAWHNEEQEPVQTAVLDVWRRQFLRPGFKPSPPQEASMFSVCFRIPKCLQHRVLSMSGSGGVYLEPRSLDAKEVDRTYDIVWVPKADKQSVQHLRQTAPASLGLARVADRFGLRVRSEQAQAVHQSIRPDAVFLSQGPRLLFSVGPIPYGTDRQALCKALKGCSWEAKPIQPVGSVDGGRGNTWTVHATTAPPTNILHMAHGEVVISTLKAPEAGRQQPKKPFGATATLSLCGSSTGSVSKDPWLVADPWQSYQGPRHEPTQHGIQDASESIRQLETKIEQAVLAKIPPQPVAMDQDDVQDRVGDLEKQVQVLMNRQQHLEASVQKHHVQQSAQLTQLQTQLNAQSQQVAGQLANQQQNMQQLFDSQMSQIRTLLSKRPRDEEGE